MGVGLKEVPGRACDFFDLTRGDEGGVDGGEGVGVKRQDVVKNRAAAGEIEVSVVGQIEDGLFIRGAS